MPRQAGRRGQADSGIRARHQADPILHFRCPSRAIIVIFHYKVIVEAERRLVDPDAALPALRIAFGGECR
ncbi:hypothetical protein J19TS2_45730 [Cohnella xylanilytica]|nr:hypothetical protein J19TS2_45730 [Cohnella xylanilytica]